VAVSFTFFEWRGGDVKARTNDDRLALEFALQDGRAVGFAVEDMPLTAMLSVGAGEEVRAAGLQQADPRLQKLFSDVQIFTMRLNDVSPTTKLDAHDYSDAVCVRLHHLLHFSPLGSIRPVAPLDNLVHLALVAIMTTLMPEYFHNQARYNLLSNLLRRALQSHEGDDEIILWALFVGFSTVLNNEVDARWIKVLALDASVRLGLGDWGDVSCVLRKYGWIHVFYDRFGTRLWEDVGRGKFD
jgi:hypothetical protein